MPDCRDELPYVIGKESLGRALNDLRKPDAHALPGMGLGVVEGLYISYIYDSTVYNMPWN
jgi:hypothetical protein